MNTKEFVVNLIGQKYPLPNIHNIDQYDYIENGHVDSFAMIRFVATIENQFSIELFSEELTDKQFRTIQGLVDLIERKRSNSAQ